MHQLNWKPGTWGKGWRDPEGFIHTWSTGMDEDGDPTHNSYIRGHGQDPSNLREGDRFHVRPDGYATSYGSYGYPEPWRGIRDLHELDPTTYTVVPKQDYESYLDYQDDDDAWHISKLANILDPVHTDLTPYVWDRPETPEPKLKPEHREFIMDEVYKLAAKFHPKPEAWLSLVFTGSLTTYQYSEASDVDISLFVDHNVLPEWDRAKLIGLMVEHMDGKKLPGTPYPLQCFVVPPEIHRDDLYQQGLRSGYDIEKDTWIIPPDPSRTHDVEREYNAYYVYALESADKMERLLKYEPDKAVMFWHQIHKRRQRDQRSGKGDFSESNIVYKFLANRNLFPEISEVSGEYIAATMPRMAVTAPHGQDWDQWMATRPPYSVGEHQLGWDPDHHDNGKGFILQDGTVWTWPTLNERPQHMEYAAKVKAQSGALKQHSAFHIGPDGSVFFFGEGRHHTPEDQALVQQADPRLHYGERPQQEWEDNDLWTDSLA